MDSPVTVDLPSLRALTVTLFRDPLAPVPDVRVIPFKDASRFRAGSIHEHHDFWFSHVLKHAPSATRDFLTDVLLHGFDVPSYFTSTPPRLASRVRNRIPPEFNSLLRLSCRVLFWLRVLRVYLLRGRTLFYPCR